jgi:hypothetical protein
VDNLVDHNTMAAAADLLWHSNNEYQKRLKHARMYLGLLEELILNQQGDGSTLAALRRAGDYIETLLEDHRAWRHRYYYQSLDTRRMVQAQGAIHQALNHFRQMRSRHERELSNLIGLLVRVQRPDPAMTRVPTGDLWVMAEFAVADLTRFDDYMQSLAHSH